MRRKREPETASIAAVTHDGRGIADLTGKKVFVAGALEGETVRFVRRKSRRKFDEAELLEVIDASPERVAARCEVFGRCGGCSLQHVSAGQQRDIKFCAQRLQGFSVEMIQPLNHFGSPSSNLPAFKAMMQIIGLDCGPIRLPHITLSAEQTENLSAAMEVIGFFEWGCDYSIPIQSK